MKTIWSYSFSLYVFLLPPVDKTAGDMVEYPKSFGYRINPVYTEDLICSPNS